MLGMLEQNDPLHVNPALNKTIQQIEAKQACIAIMGMGYVGLPLLSAFYQAGYSVIGFDPNQSKIDTLVKGQSYIQDVPDSQIQTMLQCSDSQSVLFTHQASDISEADVIIICVPTPLHKSKEPDLSFILSAAEMIAKQIRAGQLIILESTTYPGTTDEILLPMFRHSGLNPGKDFLLAFSPERIDPGNRAFQVTDIPKVVGGITELCTQTACRLYQSVMPQVHPVSSPRVAETAKILENTFRSVNIALVNEFASICRTLDVDVWEVIEAAATKPFGFMKFLPGPGIGGHCIPLDPHYLIWKSRLHGFEPRFMALADQINSNMPKVVVQLLMDALNDVGKALKGSKILVLGVSYKADVDDARESPAIQIIPLLIQKGADASYHDPFVPVFDLDDTQLSSLELTAESLADFDAALVLTAHQAVDYALVSRCVPLILDTRNVMRQVADEHQTARIVYL